MMHRLAAPAFALSLVLVPPSIVAQDSDGPFVRAMLDGETSLSFRYRFEHVSDDTSLKDANASTLRTLLGWRSGEFRGFTAHVEFNNTAVVVTERYDSGPGGNGRDRFSTVSDPKTTRVNQAHLDFHRVPRSVLRIGNQRITHDNHRHIGNVGFRQQEQTYEGVRLISDLSPNVIFDYAQVQRVNRILADSDDTDVSHQFVNLRIIDPGVGTLTAYGYFLDYREDATDSSTATLGARLSGAMGLADNNEFNYAVEYARQEDHGSFPGDYRSHYRLVEVGLSGPEGLSLTIGRELLGADGDAGKGFETRLATLHAHNGWTDRFGVTPAAGLEDTYVELALRTRQSRWSAVWHDFRADLGDQRYGREWGLRWQRPLGEHRTLEVKYARYNAKAFSVDTDKLWLTAEFSL